MVSLLAKSISSRGDWSPVKSVFASMAVSSAAAPPAWDRAIDAWQSRLDMEKCVQGKGGSADGYI